MTELKWVDRPAPEESDLVHLLYYERDDETYYLEPVASFGGNAVRVWKRTGDGPLEVAEFANV